MIVISQIDIEMTNTTEKIDIIRNHLKGEDATFADNMGTLRAIVQEMFQRINMREEKTQTDIEEVSEDQRERIIIPSAVQMTIAMDGRVIMMEDFDG